MVLGDPRWKSSVRIESLPPPPLAELRTLTGLALEVGVTLREGPRATVWRHAVAGGGAVIVKRTTDPNAATAARERAAYAALSGAKLPVPRCLASQGDLLALEAVPGEPLPPEPAAMAPAVLHRVARTLGNLHAGAREAGRHLPGSPALEEQAQTLRDAWPRIEAFVGSALGSVPVGLEAALARLADAVANVPAEACTLTLGDMAPSNVLVSDAHVNFVDLEYAGLREPFYDAMFWRVIVPMPLDLSRDLDTTYRAALADADWPLDEATFAEGRARAAAHRLCWTLSWGLDGLLELDWPVVPEGPGMRQVLLGYLRQFIDVAGPLDPLLPATAVALREALVARWSKLGRADP